MKKRGPKTILSMADAVRRHAKRRWRDKRIGEEGLVAAIKIEQRLRHLAQNSARGGRGA